MGVVDSIDSAIAHIQTHTSGHTEAILTRDLAAARRFVAEVDSSAVMVNASTRFNDGGQLGLGAEIGISTDKFHARGPCGLRALTSTKWVVYGDGHVPGLTPGLGVGDRGMAGVESAEARRFHTASSSCSLVGRRSASVSTFRCA